MNRTFVAGLALTITTVVGYEALVSTVVVPKQNRRRYRQNHLNSLDSRIKVHEAAIAALQGEVQNFRLTSHIHQPAIA